MNNLEPLPKRYCIHCKQEVMTDVMFEANNFRNTENSNKTLWLYAHRRCIDLKLWKDTNLLIDQVRELLYFISINPRNF